MLKNSLLSITKPRLAVLSALLKAARPLSQKQISVKSGLKNPDKTTIYRTLETLIKAGIVHRVNLTTKQQHFELAANCSESQCHPHLTCNSCGETFCLTNLSVPKVKKHFNGFIISHQQVQLEGLCSDCKKK